MQSPFARTDIPALPALLRQYKPLLRSLERQYSLSRDDSHDAAQDAYISCATNFTAPTSGDPATAFAGYWVKTTKLNAAHIRSYSPILSDLDENFEAVDQAEQEIDLDFEAIASTLKQKLSAKAFSTISETLAALRGHDSVRSAALAAGISQQALDARVKSITSGAIASQLHN